MLTACYALTQMANSMETTRKRRLKRTPCSEHMPKGVPLTLAGLVIPWRQLPPAVGAEVLGGVVVGQAACGQEEVEGNRSMSVWRSALWSDVGQANWTCECVGKAGQASSNTERLTGRAEQRRHLPASTSKRM